MTASEGIFKLTGSGEGAIAVYRFSGSAATQLASARLKLRTATPLSEIPQNRIFYGLWQHQDGDSQESSSGLQEDVVVCRTAALSYELHTHGSPAVEESLHRLCREHGVNWITPATETVDFLTVDESVEWGQRLEFLERIGRPDPHVPNLATWLAGQLQTTLLKCRSVEAGECLIQNARFRFFEALERLQELPNVADRIGSIDRLLESWQYGKHLVDPMVVLMTGPPNVGKSSLINRMLGYQRSLVSDSAGTTRDLVIQETMIEGWPFLLVDSAGIRNSQEVLEALGIQRATEARQVADLIVEVRSPLEMQTLGELEDSPRTIRVLNKVDLAGSELSGFDLATSALRGHGISQLLSVLAERSMTIMQRPDDWKTRPVVTTEPIQQWLMQLKVHLLDESHPQ